jgi:hypothetical protein
MEGKEMVQIDIGYMLILLLVAVYTFIIRWVFMEKHTKNLRSRGLYEKYLIKKTNGNPVDPEARYFVLRYDKDPHAWRALAWYARDVSNDNPKLHDDLEIQLRACRDKIARIIVEGQNANQKP